MRALLIAVTALSFAAGSAPAFAAPCKDAKGKFTKCPEKPKTCRDAKGKFIKCAAK